MPKAGIQLSKKDEWHTPKDVVEFGDHIVGTEIRHWRLNG